MFLTLFSIGVIFITKTIYLDVLISLNIFINYFILLGTAKFNKIPVRKLRLFFGAFFGALTSMLILFPPLTSILNFLIKLFIALIIILITFGVSDKKTFFKNLLTFYLVTFLFLGSMIAIWLIFTPIGMVINNNIIYFDIPAIIIILSSLLSYFIVFLINKFISINLPKKVFCNLKIYNSNSYCDILAKIDTGNSLKEPFSLAPVIIVKENAITNIISEDLKKYLFSLKKNNLSCFDNKNFRIIPFNTINSSGLLPAFKPDKIYINNKICTKDTYIAICDDDKLNDNFKAIVNIECLN